MTTITLSPGALLCGITIIVILTLAIQDTFVVRTDPKDDETKKQQKQQVSWKNISEGVALPPSSSQSENRSTGVPAWLFEESETLFSTPGSHLVSNVCMHSSPPPGARWLMTNGNNVTLPSIKGRGQLTEFGIFSNANITSTLINGFPVTAFIEGETVLLNLAETDINPGHCMNDMVFSLVRDVVDRNLLSRSSGPVYPHFVYLGYDPGECHNFCCDFLSTKLEFIPSPFPKGFVSPPMLARNISDSGDGHSPPSLVCFEKMIIPRVTAMRHSYVSHHEAESKALRLVQSHVFHNTSIMPKLLDSRPWSDSDVANTTSANIPLLLYGREDMGYRVLTNASDFKTMLQNEYDVQQIDYVDGPFWASMIQNQTAQAVFYNSHRHILTVHGAHLANLFYARPGTKVFEIQCWMPPRGFRYILQQWFSIWAPVLGVKYAVYTERAGCETNGQRHKLYSPPQIVITDMAAFKKQVSDFFEWEAIEQPTATNNGTTRLRA